MIYHLRVSYYCGNLKGIFQAVSVLNDLQVQLFFISKYFKYVNYFIKVQ